MLKAILIHGNGGGTADDLWFPAVERGLADLGLEVINRTFPDSVKARARYWLPFIDELGADENTILIGHSSGAVAAMRYAETHRLLGSVLISACHTDLGDPGERASGYYSSPWQWEAIRRNQLWIGQFHSADDPLVPVSEARHVAAKLRCSYFELNGRGHFVDDAAFPEVIEFVHARISG